MIEGNVLKKSYIITILTVFASLLIFQISRLMYLKNIAIQPEPVFLEGALNYRLNFRDVGASLNQCLGRNQFETDLIFHSNKFFSGWNCNKIHNPKKIYSLNYNPKHPKNIFVLVMVKNSLALYLMMILSLKISVH